MNDTARQVSPPVRNAEIVIVGAGPAGLAAALEARALGAQVLVIDEYGAAGGQYYRQPAFPAGATARSPQAREGWRLTEEAQRAGVEFWPDALVWGAFPTRELCVDRDGRSETVRAARIIVATGAHDRALPFPGWTLPGVLTPGAAQTMLKAHGVLPGGRIVVAGSGPFLLVVAGELAKAGAHVELIEATHPRLAAFFGLLRFPERWGEFTRHLATLCRHGVRLQPGRVVVRAEAGADGQLARVFTQRITRLGTLKTGTEREHRADTLALAYGFRAQAELGRLLGAQHEYDESRGGACLRIDRDTGETSAEGVYAAGESTGVAGSQVARNAGRIAGLCAARSLGRWSAAADARLAGAQRDRRRDQAFADLVARTFAVPAALTGLATSTTVVCRCEGVERAAIDAAIDAGARSTSAVKRWTRCGMGPCQGRMCNWALARLVAERCGLPLAQADDSVPRVPLKPVTLAHVLASGEGDSGDQDPPEPCTG